MEVFIAKGEEKDSEVKIPTSKSLSHRALLAASLCNETSIIEDLVHNKDTEATIRVLKSLGATFVTEDNKTIVHGISYINMNADEVLDCGESGSTLRFMIPLFGLMNKEVKFTGHGRLMERPQSVYAKIFNEQGLLFAQEDSILKIKGPLQSGHYEIKGNISSQFITGLLYALPLLDEDSVIKILPPYESKSYVKMTEYVLEKAGITIEDRDDVIYIPGKQKYKSIHMKVDGDDSQAAFFACLSQIKKEKITLLGMNQESKQGDHAIIDILRKYGANITEEKDKTTFLPSMLQATEVDLSDCPDLGPILFALASVTEGTSHFINASRLRVKESDRIACMEEELKKLGCNIQSTIDTVTIRGIDKIKENVHLEGHNDHRIVMALSVLLASIENGGYIHGAEAITKSYPDFFEDLEKCGVEVKNMISKMAKITIVGLGLLGGSYAKGFFNAGYHNVYGIDIDQEAIAFGKKYHWIKDGGSDPTLASDSDIVISALYPHTFVEWVKENQHLFKPGTVLTDVTGVKREVIKEIKEILREDIIFIPCHPMAGREYKGIQYADASLFHSANFIIIKEKNTNEKGLQTAYDIAKILSFKHIAELTAEEHDEMIGFLSQLTHVIAVSLMNANDNSHLSEYTGDSFRDLTRIAKINKDLWPELFSMNKDYLIHEIDQFVNEMNAFKGLLETDDFDGMKAKLVQSTQRRKVFDKK